jgi:predicted GIY-YIG superfamily endonuclease
MYYTGSTRDLDRRIVEHEVWDGAKSRDSLFIVKISYMKFPDQFIVSSSKGLFGT